MGFPELPAYPFRDLFAFSKIQRGGGRGIQGRQRIGRHGNDRPASPPYAEKGKTISDTLCVRPYLLDRGAGGSQDVGQTAEEVAPRSDPEHLPKQRDDVQSSIRPDRHGGGALLCCF